MGRKYYIIFNVLLTGLVTASNYKNDACKIPSGDIGSCINVRHCPEVQSILMKSNRSPEDFKYLKSIQCGFDHKDPLVCCLMPSGTKSPTENFDGGSFIEGDDRSNQHRSSNSNDILPIDCGQDHLSNRIANGNVTDLSEFPWMALLEYSKPSGNVTACGGVLIHKRYVLTAAHCLKGKTLPKTWALQNVRLGEWNTETNPDCLPDGTCADEPVTIPIEDQIVHEDYQPRLRDQHNDIALIRLSQDAPLTSYIKPVCLPKRDYFSRKLWVSGWGKTEVGSRSDVKLKVEVSLVEKSSCDREFSKLTLSKSQICAGGKDNKNPCQGDSGGPLMQQDQDDEGYLRWEAVGIVSLGTSLCGVLDKPSVFTKIHDYMPWILSKLRT